MSIQNTTIGKSLQAAKSKMTPNHSSGKKVLGVFSLAMINVAAIVSLRNLPLMAEYGLAAVFFYAVAGIAFFIPIALVAAEFATTFPGQGGIYLWVKKAFGEQLGFLTVWLEWVLNAVWLPTILSFVAATVAYIFMPTLAENKLFAVGVMLVALWLTTFANFFGMKASGIISSVGSLLGTVIPGALIILLGIIYFGIGGHSQISFAPSNLIPSFEIANLVFFAGVILGFAGIEMAAFHASEARNPQKDYPKAIFLSVAMILALFMLGSLAIAIVVPHNQISLVAGLMQAFQAFFDSFGIGWLVPIIAALTGLGALAQISTWLIGPSKGLLATAEDGGLPSYFQKCNKAGIPVRILVFQGMIGTAFALVFLLLPSVSSSYWILTDLAAQITVIMYILIFVSAIKLRYSMPSIDRPFKVPGGNIGMWIIAGLGVLACVFTLILGFVPPSNIETGNLLFYELFLICGILLLAAPPFIFYHLSKKRKSHTHA